MIDYTNLMRIEYTILGTILYEPDHVGEVVAKLSPENFHMEATRGLFNAISALHFEGSPVDPVTTLQQAGKEYEPAIKEVLKCSTAVSNLPYYCDLLRDAVKLQQVQSEATGTCRRPAAGKTCDSWRLPSAPWCSPVTAPTSRSPA